LQYYKLFSRFFYETRQKVQYILRAKMSKRKAGNSDAGNPNQDIVDFLMVRKRLKILKTFSEI